MKKGFILGAAAAAVAFIVGHTIGYFRGANDGCGTDYDDCLHCDDCCSCDDCGCDDLDDEDEESAE